MPPKPKAAKPRCPDRSAADRRWMLHTFETLTAATAPVSALPAAAQRRLAPDPELRAVTAAEFEQLTGLRPESRTVGGQSLWMADAGDLLAAEIGYRALLAAGVQAYLAMQIIAAGADG